MCCMELELIQKAGIYPLFVRQMYTLIVLGQMYTFVGRIYNFHRSDVHFLYIWSDVHFFQVGVHFLQNLDVHFLYVICTLFVGWMYTYCRSYAQLLQVRCTLFISWMLGLVNSGPIVLGQAKGPSAAAAQYQIDKGIANVRLVQVKKISGPSAVAMTGQVAERCGHSYQTDKDDS